MYLQQTVSEIRGSISPNPLQITTGVRTNVWVLIAHAALDTRGLQLGRQCKQQRVVTGSQRKTIVFKGKQREENQ
jgi:hypothetical protein